MPSLDLGTLFFASAAIGLAVSFSVVAGIVTARLFFRAARDVDETEL